MNSRKQNCADGAERLRPDYFRQRAARALAAGPAPGSRKLLTLRGPVNAGQSRTFLRLLLRARWFAGFGRITDDVSDGGVLQYLGRGISHFQEHAIERAMVGIGDDEASELIRTPKGRKRAVNQTNNLADFDF